MIDIVMQLMPAVGAVYKELINKPKYAVLKKRYGDDVHIAHDGYFSQDKKGMYKDTRGDTAADHDTYATIMKDKEYLLSFECPLRFIWSHSALKEGWDNPNVFQVCTLQIPLHLSRLHGEKEPPMPER